MSPAQENTKGLSMFDPVYPNGTSRHVRFAGLLVAGLFIGLAVPVAARAQSATAPLAQPAVSPGQLPPRFASLKSDRVNVRRGPGPEHAIEWVFRRAGLPVEIIATSDIWRRVRDSEGATGWVLASLLSGRRTALIEPWEVKAAGGRSQVPLRTDDSDSAPAVAQVEAGVLANVKTCDGKWCLVSVAGYSGYVQQQRVWGVYKGEVVR
jgi:SH3-like domain-containing protein